MYQEIVLAGVPLTSEVAAPNGEPPTRSGGSPRAGTAPGLYCWTRMPTGSSVGTSGAVASLASWLPARRAAKTEPMEALRCE